MTHGPIPGTDAADLTLKAYLLGTVDFDAAVRFQRRLHFEVSGPGHAAALVLCEHPPLVSVGRLGSHAHVRLEQCRLRWVSRGGGCILHLPGQLAVYPIFPLGRLGLDVPAFLYRLGLVFLDLCADFSLRATPRVDDAGLWVGDRLLAAFGVAVRDWVSAFGAYVNVQPPLEPYRFVQTTPAGAEPMTSLERERRGPVRPALVRQRLVEHFQNRFGFARVALFSDHPALDGEVRRCEGRPAPRPVVAGRV